MSLEAIARMRRQGYKPAVVFVVIGPCAPVDDDAGMVLIREGDRPESMDWRPVVGLHLAILQTRLLPDLLLKVIDAASAAGATFYGLTDASGATHPLAPDAGPKDHANLRRAWEQVCPS